MKDLAAISEAKAHGAGVGLEIDVYTSMACEMVTFGSFGRASLPLALERKGARRLSADVNSSDVLVQRLGILENDGAVEPPTLVNLLLNLGCGHHDLRQSRAERSAPSPSPLSAAGRSN